MAITVDLDETGFARLRALASAQRVSPEAYASELLSHTLLNDSIPKERQAQNRRRLQLIEKDYSTALTVEESAELESLQQAADQWAEAWDRSLLEGSERLRREAEAVLKHPASD